MKKLICLLLASAMLCLLLVGCGSNSAEGTTVEETTLAPEPSVAFEGEFTEIYQRLLAKICELDTDEFGVNSIIDSYGCTDIPVSADACTSVLGLTDEEFAADIKNTMEHVPNGSWFAHSLVLVEVNDGVDVAALAEKIKSGTNPGRFGCIKAEAIVVDYAGSYILLAASGTSTCEAADAAFSALSALPVTRLDRENDWTNSGFGGLMVPDILGDDGN